jgi:hypothetical protein
MGPEPARRKRVTRAPQLGPIPGSATRTRLINLAGFDKKMQCCLAAIDDSPGFRRRFVTYPAIDTVFSEPVYQLFSATIRNGGHKPQFR